MTNQFEPDNYDEIVLDSTEADETDEQEDLSSKRKKIYALGVDSEIVSLLDRYERGRLNIQPDFQRRFVWDSAKSSRLIESALLGIPIPIIYLSEEKDGKVNVIDGQQRLKAFFSFIRNEIKLSGLKVFPELNNKKFEHLPEDKQDKVLRYAIRTVTFSNESDSDLQFEIFVRLNTGSVPLNAQELRNCVYRGTFNDLLKELSQNEQFRFLLGIKKEEKRMQDQEFVLRFAAFYFNTYHHYSAPIKKFLNDTMEKYRYISDTDKRRLTTAFKNAVANINSLLDNKAFKRFYRGDEKNKNGRWEERKFNVSLYDILMFSLANEDRNKVMCNLDEIREALIELMTRDQDFIDAIELSTSSKKMVTTRFTKWQATLQGILGASAKEPRCFSRRLKEELFNNDDTCTLCGNKILHIDDAAVDHIVQYWVGGKTTPENARLTHRYCNNTRPRTEE